MNSEKGSHSLNFPSYSRLVGSVGGAGNTSNLGQMQGTSITSLSANTSPTTPAYALNPSLSSYPPASASILAHQMHQHTAGFSGISAGSYAHAMLELGIRSTNREMLNSLFTTYGPMKESEVAQVLGMMAASHQSVIPPGTPLQTLSSPSSPLSPNTTLASSWNVFEFIDFAMEKNPYLKWPVVIQQLDYPEFFVHDYKGVEMIIKGFFHGVRNQQEFPIFLFCKQWMNVPGQLSFIRSALLAPVEFITFAKAGRRIINTEDVDTYPNGPTKNALFHLLNQHWNSLELIEYICGLVDTEMFEDVRPILEMASKQCPELLCLGLAYFDPPWNSLLHTILIKLITGFLSGQPSSPVVLPRLWRIHSQLMLLCMSEMHRIDPTCISRLLDISQELKILPKVLDTKPYSFTIDMASLASRREHLNLEKWLTDAMLKYRDPFVRSVLDFVVDKCFSSSGNNGRVIIPLSPDVLSLFLKALASHAPHMSFENVQIYRDIQSSLTGATSGTSLKPAPITAAAPVSLTSSLLMDDYANLTLFTDFFGTTFPKDVEEEANAVYEKIYSHEVSVHDVLDTMSRLRNSFTSRDNLVFACMVHNLLDEYRFFPKYPEKELTLTGIIFGLLINHHLLSDTALGIALRFILDALRKYAPDSKMFKFGLTALLQFQNRLAEWPPLCRSLILEVPALASHTGLGELLAYLQNTVHHYSSDLTNRSVHPILYFLDSGNGPSSGSGASAPTSPTTLKLVSLNTVANALASLPADYPGFACLALVEPLFVTEYSRLYKTYACSDIVVPSEGVQDKLHFILNNLTSGNLFSKKSEFSHLLSTSSPAILRWVSVAFVGKRIASEPNYHGLYLELLKDNAILNTSSASVSSLAQDFSLLNRFVLLELISRIRNLLDAEKTSTSSSERQILKNLGSFLGLFALAQNRPILYRHLPLKELLLEAMVIDKLIVVLPFTCKVLEGAKTSSLFAWSHPWLNAHIRLLTELYFYGDLKLNLKFEVEVLLKALNLELHDIEPSNLLKSGKSLRYRRPSQAIPSYGKTAATNSLSGITLGNLAITDSILLPGLASILVSLLSSILIPGNDLALRYNGVGYIHRLSIFAIELTLREAVSTFLDRPTSIASRTAMNLILKDFKSANYISNLSNSKDSILLNEEVLLKGGRSLLQCILTPLVNVTLRGNVLSVFSRILGELAVDDEESAQAQSLSSGKEDASVVAAKDRHVPLISYLCDTLMDGLLLPLLERLAVVRALGDFSKNLIVAARQIFGDSTSIPESIKVSIHTLSKEQQVALYEDLSTRNSRITSNSSMEIAINENTLKDNLAWGPVRGASEIDRVRQLLNTSTTTEGAAPNLSDKNALIRETSTPPTGALPAAPSKVPADISDTSTAITASGSSANAFLSHLMAIDRIIANHPNASFSSFSAEDELRVHMKRLLLLALQPNINRDDACLLFSSRILHLLYKSTSVLSIEIHVVLLDKLCELSTRAYKQVLAWLLQLSAETVTVDTTPSSTGTASAANTGTSSTFDERKWNVPVTVALFLSGLVNVESYDGALANSLIANGILSPTSNISTGLVSFAVALINRCVLMDPVVCSPFAFYRSFQVLEKLSFMHVFSSIVTPDNTNFSKFIQLVADKKQEHQSVMYTLPISHSKQEQSISDTKDKFPCKKQNYVAVPTGTLKEQVSYYWNEWKKLTFGPSISNVPTNITSNGNRLPLVSNAAANCLPDKSLLAFVHQIIRQGFLTSCPDDHFTLLTLFIRELFSNVERDILEVNIHLKEDLSSFQHTATATSLSRLIVFLLRARASDISQTLSNTRTESSKQEDDFLPDGFTSPVDLFRRILKELGLMMLKNTVKSEYSGSETNPSGYNIPSSMTSSMFLFYTRFFHALLLELTASERHLTSNIASFLSAIKPTELNSNTRLPVLSLEHVSNSFLSCLSILGRFLHALRPSLLPIWTFGWTEIVVSRSFLPRLLIDVKSESGNVINTGFQTPTARGHDLGKIQLTRWELVHMLLIDLLIGLKPHLAVLSGCTVYMSSMIEGSPTSSLSQTPISVTRAGLALPGRLLYKGIFRLFLLLLHDYPEFLCTFCSSLVSFVPIHAIQLRNLILSAFPRSLRLLDPFKVSGLQGIRDCIMEIDTSERKERILDSTNSNDSALDIFPIARDNRSAILYRLSIRGIIPKIDLIIKTAIISSSQGISSSYGRLIGSGDYVSFSTAMNSVVTDLIKCFYLKSSITIPSASDSSKTSISVQVVDTVLVFDTISCLFCNDALRRHDDGSILVKLALTLLSASSSELSFTILHALANGLRFPTSDTLSSSSLLLSLFAHPALSASIREQLTRVLLERLIVNRPHPWGLLVTFIELIRNSTYNFWNYPFTHTNPDVERLFESVAKSCCIVVMK